MKPPVRRRETINICLSECVRILGYVEDGEIWGLYVRIFEPKKLTTSDESGYEIAEARLDLGSSAELAGLFCELVRQDHAGIHRDLSEVGNARRRTRLAGKIFAAKRSKSSNLTSNRPKTEPNAQ